MKMSRLARLTSANYAWSHVWSEIVELCEVRSWAELEEEVRDVVTTFALYLYCNWGVDLYLPGWLSSSEKYLGRLEICKEVLRQAGLYNAARDAGDPYYWRRYTTAGSNMERPHKKRAFLENARQDFQ